MRDTLTTLAVKCNSKLLMDAYKQLRNRVNSLNIQLKRQYFSEKIMQYYGNLNKTWKSIDQVINKRSNTTVVPSLCVEGQVVKGNKAIAASMNEYFCSIGNKLNEKIPERVNPLLCGKYLF